MSKIRQFGLFGLLFWTFVAAIVCSLCVYHETISVVIASCLLSVAAGLRCYRSRFSITFCFTIPGLVFALSLFIAFVSYKIANPVRYQGQLYYEDGPEAYFIIMSVLFFLLGLALSILGAIFGFTLHCFLKALKWEQRQQTFADAPLR